MSCQHDAEPRLRQCRGRDPFGGTAGGTHQHGVVVDDRRIGAAAVHRLPGGGIVWDRSHRQLGSDGRRRLSQGGIESGHRLVDDTNGVVRGTLGGEHRDRHHHADDHQGEQCRGDVRPATGAFGGFAPRHQQRAAPPAHEPTASRKISESRGGANANERTAPAAVAAARSAAGSAPAGTK